MKNIFIMLALLFVQTGRTQDILEGKILDVKTSVGIPFAQLFFPDLQTGLMADSAGHFIFNQAPKGVFKIQVSAVGYESQLLEYVIDGKELVVILSPKHIMLDKVIISNSNGLLQRDNITNVESVQLSEISEIPAAGIGEMMANIPGVYQSTSGTGVSKPVVRGLSGPRVVTYLNGLRIENQQWGSDHGIGVTDLGIGGVEIIKGPASLLYGSDAMGGVVYFIDEPFTSPNKVEGYFRSQFDAVSMGSTNRLAVKMNVKGLKLNVFGGLSDHADYQLPNGKYVENSRYSERMFKAALGYNKKNWATNLRYNFLHQTPGIIVLEEHDHEGEEEHGVEELQVDNQERGLAEHTQLIENHYLSWENKLFFKKSTLSLLLGNTSNHLRELEEGVTAIDMKLNNSTYNLKLERQLNDEIKVMLGSQGMFRVNMNDKFAEEFLIPDATTMDLGIYALLAGRIDKWRYQLGGRLDSRQIETRITAGEFQDLTRSFSSMNYSLGLARIGENSSLRINVSTGFRAPTASELTAYGAHHGSNRFEIGDANLKRELAIQTDVSYGLHYEHFEFIINPFYNNIRNYIALVKQDSMAEDLDVYRYTRLDMAHLAGGDVGVHYHPHFAHWLHLESSYSFIYTEDENGRPLGLIPQNRINSRIKLEFHMHSKFKFENLIFQYVYCFEQNRVTELESRSKDYHLLNVGMNVKWDIRLPIDIAVGVKNALNQEIYDHLSRIKDLGLSAPGWNAYISVKINFASKKDPDVDRHHQQ